MGRGDRGSARGPRGTDAPGNRVRAARAPRPCRGSTSGPSWRQLDTHRMSTDRSRPLEIDGPPLDASAVVLGTGCHGADDSHSPHAPDSPAVVWEGSIAGDGTGP